MDTMTDPISPPHYQRSQLETIDTILDVVKDLPGDEAALVSNILKYLVRYRFKEHTDPLEDIKKAQWYISKLVLLLEGKSPTADKPRYLKKEYPMYPVDN
jgi:hypothetical protein